MTAEIGTTHSFSTPFVTALLLTGGVKEAETAMLEGIRSLNIDAAAGEDELLQTAVAAAIKTRRRYGRHTPEETAQASSLLPAKLQGVLNLPAHLRECFVLRLLVNMPRESCAQLLALDAAHVDRNVGLAAQELTRTGRASVAAETRPERMSLAKAAGCVI